MWKQNTAKGEMRMKKWMCLLLLMLLAVPAAAETGQTAIAADADRAYMLRENCLWETP